MYIEVYNAFKYFVFYNFLIYTVCLEKLYAFSYNPPEDKISQSTGWVLYDPKLEFARMEITPDTWKASDLNEDYKVSFKVNYAFLTII